MDREEAKIHLIIVRVTIKLLYGGTEKVGKEEW